MTTISKTSGLLLAALVGGLSLTASAAIDPTQLPAPSAKTGVTYTNDIEPLLKASCVRCHSGDKARAGLHLDSLEGVLKGAEKGPVVTVGDSAKSLIVEAMSQLDPKTAMPPKPRPPRNNAGGPGGPGGPGTAPAGTNAAAGGPPQRPAGPPPKPLTPDEVGLVRAWIDQGAK